MSLLVVGMDVSPKHTVVCALEDQGQQGGKRASFPNTLPGAEQVERWIVDQIRTAGAAHLIVGTEATSF